MPIASHDYGYDRFDRHVEMRRNHLVLIEILAWLRDRPDALRGSIGPRAWNDYPEQVLQEDFQ